MLLFILNTEPAGPYVSFKGQTVDATLGQTNASGTPALVPYPTTTSGDVLLLLVSSKYPTDTNPAAPSGWTAITNGQGTGGTLPSPTVGDTGTTSSTVFYKEADGTETGNVSVVLNGAQSGRMLGATMMQFGKYGSLGIVATNGSLNTVSSASLSIPFNSDPGLIAGDEVVILVSFNTDAYTYSAPVISIPGCTLETPTMFQQKWTAGQDATTVYLYAKILTGTSTGAGTLTLTSSGFVAETGLGVGNPEGSAVLVGMRGVLGSLISIPVGTGSFTGLAPSLVVTNNVILFPSLGTLTASGFIPVASVSNNISISVPLGTAAYSGLLPVVRVGVNIITALGSGTYTGLLPSVLATNNISRLIGLGQETASGFAPVKIIGTVVYPGTGSELTTGLAPLILTPRNIPIGLGTSVVSGQVPSVAISNLSTVDVGYGQPVFTGFSPVANATAHQVISIPKGSGSYSGLAPVSVTNTIRTINFPSNGILAINPTTHPEIQPGDTVQLRANGNTPKCVLISDISGTIGTRINFTNYPGEQLVVSNPSWVLSDGFGVSFQFLRCKHFNLYGTGFSGEGIKSDGPITSDFQQFFHYQFLDFTDNFSIYDVSSYNGGTGIQCKTFVTSNSATWRENTTLHNVVIGGELDPWQPGVNFRIKLQNTGNEAIYFGDTATYVNKDTGVVFQPSSVSDPIPAGGTAVYKKPVKYDNVLVKNVFVNGSGADGLQFAACNNLEVCNNYVTGWASLNAEGHKGGILIGGSVTSSYVHDNICENSSFGHGLWHFAEGPGHIVDNNLFYNHDGYMVFIKGGTHLVPDSDYHVILTNNTFADNGTATSSSGIRINGIQGGTLPQSFDNNIIAQVGGEIFDGSTEFIVTENGGQIDLGTGADVNVFAETISELGLNTGNWLEPFVEPGGAVDGKGFRFAETVTEVFTGTGQAFATGYAPVINIRSGILPGTGQAIATGFAPFIPFPTVVRPGAGQGIALGFNPTLLIEPFVQSDTGIIRKGKVSEVARQSTVNSFERKSKTSLIERESLVT